MFLVFAWSHVYWKRWSLGVFQCFDVSIKMKRGRCIHVRADIGVVNWHHIASWCDYASPQFWRNVYYNVCCWCFWYLLGLMCTENDDPLVCFNVLMFRKREKKWSVVPTDPMSFFEKHNKHTHTHTHTVYAFREKVANHSFSPGHTFQVDFFEFYIYIARTTPPL